MVKRSTISLETSPCRRAKCGSNPFGGRARTAATWAYRITIAARRFSSKRWRSRKSRRERPLPLVTARCDGSVLRLGLAAGGCGGGDGGGDFTEDRRYRTRDARREGRVKGSDCGDVQRVFQHILAACVLPELYTANSVGNSSRHGVL